MSDNSTISNARIIEIHTGNMMNCNVIKPNILRKPTEELSDCLGYTLREWKKETDIDNTKKLEDIRCTLPSTIQDSTLPADKRETFKVTLKICLTDIMLPCIKKAVISALEELSIKAIETVILSLSIEHQAMEHLKPVWTCLEEFVNENKVFRLGVSDLEQPLLQELYEFATIKPSINQVNLDTCCVIPPELSTYAKEHDIQLLTHNDPPTILPCSEFQRILRENLSEADSIGWRPRYMARYSVMIKTRGVLHSKGYIVKAIRDL